VNFPYSPKISHLRDKNIFQSMEIKASNQFVADISQFPKSPKKKKAILDISFKEEHDDTFMTRQFEWIPKLIQHNKMVNIGMIFIMDMMRARCKGKKGLLGGNMNVLIESAKRSRKTFEVIVFLSLKYMPVEESTLSYLENHEPVLKNLAVGLAEIVGDKIKNVIFLAHGNPLSLTRIDGNNTRLRTQNIPSLQVASLHLLSRLGSGSNVHIWRPKSYQFGLTTDIRLSNDLEAFCSDSLKPSFDMIRRTPCFKVSKSYKDVDPISREDLFVNWEQNAFPKHLFHLFLPYNIPVSMEIYYERIGERMLPPRLYEVSENLGMKGIADVFDGKRYRFLSLIFLGICLVQLLLFYYVDSSKLMKIQIK
jgi:hypothetical protein